MVHISDFIANFYQRSFTFKNYQHHQQIQQYLDCSYILMHQLNNEIAHMGKGKQVLVDGECDEKSRKWVEPRGKKEEDSVNNFSQLMMNSLTINKKLHDQIISREYQIKAENKDMNIKMTSIYRQMEQIHHKTQTFYEETVRQNQKARFLAEEIIKPFREQLKHKVDQTTLSIKMKMLLSQFDNMGHKISYDNQGKVVQSTNYAFDFIKMELLPIIAAMESRMTQLQAKNQCQNKRIDQVFLSEQQIQSKIQKINTAISQNSSNIVNQVNKKLSQYALQINVQQIWQKTTQNLQILKLQFSQQFAQNQSKIIQIKNKLHQIASQTRVQKCSPKKYDNQIGVSQIQQIFFQRFDQVKQQIKHFQQQIKKNEQSQIFKQRSQLKKNQDKLKQVVEQGQKLKKMFQNLSESIKSQGSGSISKNIISKITKLQAEAKIYQVLSKNNQKKIIIQEGQILSVKNLLSQKANFSDFIRVIEMKADKEDYKQLRELIQTKNTVNTPDAKDLDYQLTQLGDDQNGSIQGFKLRTKKSHSGHHRNNIMNSPSLKSRQHEDSIKKYMLGLDSSLHRNGGKQKSKLMFVTQGERRKWNLGQKQEFEQNTE